MYCMPGTTENSGMQESVVLQIFTKEPRPGHVKTRLQTVLSPQESADLHASLTEACVQKFLHLPPWFRLEIWGDAPASGVFYSELLERYPRIGFRRQKGRDLGMRMAFAFNSGLLRHQGVILTGSDCPLLDVDHVVDVHRHLHSRRINLIEAEDGGYVLIAGKSRHSGIFRGIDWGTPSVLSQTAAAIRRTGLGMRTHGCLWDIDDERDLARYRDMQERL